MGLSLSVISKIALFGSVIQADNHWATYQCGPV